MVPLSKQGQFLLEEKGENYSVKFRVFKNLESARKASMKAGHQFKVWKAARGGGWTLVE